MAYKDRFHSFSEMRLLFPFPLCLWMVGGYGGSLVPDSLGEG